MGEDSQNKESVETERKLLLFILMDLVEHGLLTPNEAEHARRIYLEMMKDKAESKL